MDTVNQLSYFGICVIIGIVSGFIADIITFIPYLFNKKWVLVVFDIISSIVISLIFIFICTKFVFPQVRAYMYVGILAGCVLYLKTFHIPVDFFKKLCYNKIIKVSRKLKSVRKTRKKLQKKEV